MTAKVITFHQKEYEPNTRGYPHVICGDCHGDLFTVCTSDKDGKEAFYMLICENCGNEIPINMTPVWGPE